MIADAVAIPRTFLLYFKRILKEIQRLEMMMRFEMMMMVRNLELELERIEGLMIERVMVVMKSSSVVDLVIPNRIFLLVQIEIRGIYEPIWLLLVVCHHHVRLDSFANVDLSNMCKSTDDLVVRVTRMICSNSFDSKI
jgi:hypothetical protein